MAPPLSRSGRETAEVTAVGNTTADSKVREEMRPLGLHLEPISSFIEMSYWNLVDPLSSAMENSSR